MDIEIDGDQKGRIIFGLFGDLCPKAVENFVRLCRCDEGKRRSKIGNKPLCYRDSIFHRVIPNFMIQGETMLLFLCSKKCSAFEVAGETDPKRIELTP